MMDVQKSVGMRGFFEVENQDSLKKKKKTRMLPSKKIFEKGEQEKDV